MKKLMMMAMMVVGMGVAWAERPDYELEYVTADGNCWVDTGVKPTRDIKVEATFAFDGLKDGGAPWGTRYSGYNQLLYAKAVANKAGDATNYTFNVSLGNGGLFGSNAPEDAPFGSKVTAVLSPAGFFVNGVELVTAATMAKNADISNVGGRSITLFVSASSATPSEQGYKGRIYSVRIWNAGVLVRDFVPAIKGTTVYMYDRVNEVLYANKRGTLTAGPVLDISDRFTVVADPFAPSGTFVPAVGETSEQFVTGLASGDTRPVSAPNTMTCGDHVTVTCTGWKLYSYNAETHAYVFDETRTDATGSGNAFTYTHDGRATRLVWQYAATHDFADATTFYVKPTGDDTAAGDSWEKAKASVNGAVSAAATDSTTVILVAPGTYVQAADSAISVPAKVLGIDGQEGKPTLDGKESKRLVYLNNADALVDNFHLYCGYAGSGSKPQWRGGGIRISSVGGKVTNCFLEKCCSGNEQAGGSIYLEGGTVSKCRITGGYTVNNNGDAAAAYLNGADAVLENSLVYENGNINTMQGWHYKKGVVQIDKGTVRACTIVKNHASAAGGVKVGKNGALIDTIVWGNETWNDTTDGAPNWQIDTGATVTGCISSVAWGDGMIATDPCFVDFANGDYRLAPGSRGRDAATAEATVTTDLNGNPRVQGTKADVGAFESDPDEKAVGFTVAQVGTVDASTVTLNAAATGIDLTSANLYWTTNGTTPSAENYVATGTGCVLTLGPGLYTPVLAVVSGDETYIHQGAQIKVCASEIAINEGDSLDDKLALVTDGSVVTFGEGTFTSAADNANANYEAVISVVRPNVVIRSVNGAANTIIDGQGKKRVLNVRSAGAWVEGLTLTRGWVKYDGGGSVYVSDGVLTNCVISSGTASDNKGSGVYMTGGTVTTCRIANNVNTSGSGAGNGAYLYGANAVIENSLFVGNTGGDSGSNAEKKKGGGAYIQAGTIRFCTFTCNTNGYAGGVYLENSKSAVLRDSIVHGNRNLKGEIDLEVAGSSAVVDNVRTEDPSFNAPLSGDYTLASGSPCIDAAGTTPTMAYDLAGLDRISGGIADLGCYEYDKSVLAFGIQATPRTTVAPAIVDFAVVVPEGVETNALTCYWTFDGRTPTEEDHDASGVTTTRSCDAGAYSVGLAVQYGGKWYYDTKASLFTITSPRLFVVTENPNAASPYDTWETAATNVNQVLALVGDGTVLTFGDGVFRLPLSLELNSGVTVTSLNGPAATTLKGLISAVTDVPSYRCFYLKNENVKVCGVTIANAANLDGGGGVKITAGVVSNCVITTCEAKGNSPGGGVYLEGGTLVDCVVTNCTTVDNGANPGGGVYATGEGTLVERCVIVDNYNTRDNPSGGGVCVAAGAICRNSLILRNQAPQCGGALVYGSAKLINCTVISNFANKAKGTVGGVTAESASRVDNNIIRDNYSSVATLATPDAGGTEAAFMTNAIPIAFGAKCVTGDPRFVDAAAGDWRLTIESPCRNAGANNIYGTKDDARAIRDLDGNPRLYGPRIDLGAYELQAGPGLMLLVK